MSNTQAPAPGELIRAAQVGAVKLIESLLDRGADIEERDNSGDTPLNEAARMGQLGAVRVLVERGANLNARNNNGKTAVTWAREGTHGHVAHFLEIEADELQRLIKLKETQTSHEWLLMDEEAVAYVSTYPRQYRKITEFFNMASRERLIISENLATKAESITPPTSFDDLPQERLVEMVERVKALGGTVDDAFVLRGKKPLEKKNKLN